MTGESISFRPTPEQYGFTFGGLEPVLAVDPDTALTHVVQGHSRISNPLDRRSSHDVAAHESSSTPGTGAFFIDEGTAPRDVITIHLVDLTPAPEDWGVKNIIPCFGGLTGAPLNASLRSRCMDDRGSTTMTAPTHTLGYAARASDSAVSLPARRGSSALSESRPLRRKIRTSLVPDYFGRRHGDTRDARRNHCVPPRGTLETSSLSSGGGELPDKARKILWNGSRGATMMQRSSSTS